MSHQVDPAGIPVRLDYSNGDSFYRAQPETRHFALRGITRYIFCPAITCQYNPAPSSRDPSSRWPPGTVVGVSELQFEDAGLGAEALDYLAAWDLQRAAARHGSPRRPPRHRAAAGAPARLHRGQAHRADERPLDGTPSSTSTAAARSPGTAPASWSATRSSALPDHVDVVAYVRRVEEALIGSAPSSASPPPGRRPLRRLVRRRPRPGAQDRGDRHPGLPAA